MSTTATHSRIRFNRRAYHEQVGLLVEPVLNRLHRLLSMYVLFNGTFILLGTFEIGLFLSFYALLKTSQALAIILGLFFLTFLWHLGKLNP